MRRSSIIITLELVTLELTLTVTLRKRGKMREPLEGRAVRKMEDHESKLRKAMASRGGSERSVWKTLSTVRYACFCIQPHSSCCEPRALSAPRARGPSSGFPARSWVAAQHSQKSTAKLDEDEAYPAMGCSSDASLPKCATGIPKPLLPSEINGPMMNPKPATWKLVCMTQMVVRVLRI